LPDDRPSASSVSEIPFLGGRGCLDEPEFLKNYEILIAMFFRYEACGRVKAAVAGGFSETVSLDMSARGQKNTPSR
jgi:hypothetical protein